VREGLRPSPRPQKNSLVINNVVWLYFHMTQKVGYRTVAVPQDMHRELRRYGVEHDLAITAMVQEAIGEWLERKSLVPLSGGAALAVMSGPAVGFARLAEIVGQTPAETADGRPTLSTQLADAEREFPESGETF
jgi:hypothetical protein